MKHFSLFSEQDIYLFREGSNFKLYDKFGAHTLEVDGVSGTYFAVWAPNAEFVSVIGNFNGWNRQAHPLNGRWDGSGIWGGFITAGGKGEIYKDFIRSR